MDTILVSVMHANNELGTLNDIAAIGAITRAAGVLFHSDAAQSVGKVAIDLGQWDVDLMSVSAHKLYGPKGMGALYVRRQPRVGLEAQMHGGGHERGMRSGTLATHQIVGLGEAARLATESMAEESARLLGLRRRFWEGIRDLGDIHLNGHPGAAPGRGAQYQRRLCRGRGPADVPGDLALSTGSACTSASLELSHVLRAIGLPDELAYSALRFSFGRFTTDEDVAAAVGQCVTRCKSCGNPRPSGSPAARARDKAGCAGSGEIPLFLPFFSCC